MEVSKSERKTEESRRCSHFWAWANRVGGGVFQWGSMWQRLRAQTQSWATWVWILALPLFHFGAVIFLICDEDNQITCIIELLFGLRGLILTCSEQCLAGNKCYMCLLYNQNRWQSRSSRFGIKDYEFHFGDPELQKSVEQSRIDLYKAIVYIDLELQMGSALGILFWNNLHTNSNWKQLPSSLGSSSKHVFSPPPSPEHP